MAAASPAMPANPVEYRFGGFRLIPSTRELWKGGALHHVQPLAFDCLVYLLEHRQRVVGRDELASAVWASVDIGDQQIRQLVLRARQAVGDDAKAQRAIRTVSGGGYRWVMPVETAQAMPPGAAVPTLPGSGDPVAATIETAEAANAEPDVPATGIPASRATSSTPSPPFRARLIALVALVLLLVLGAALVAWQPRRAPVPAAENPPLAAETIVVLPLNVAASEDAGWVRLGAMDLVGQRMREAGMPVSPSDNVVAAIHAIGSPDRPERLARLRDTLGAAAVIQGTASRSDSGWKVQLDTTAPDGIRHSAEAQRADVIEAARQAADLLAASLGYVDAAGLEESRRGEGAERLQRARAALLANQTEAAHTILANLPEPEKSDPLARALLGRVEFRAGRTEQARILLEGLMTDPAVRAQPLAYAQALTTLGFIGVRDGDWAVAETRFGGAVEALGDRGDVRELGLALAARGLARSGLHRYDEATADLARAGPLLQQAGDRMGVARVDNYFGQLEIARNRPADAVPYFSAAAAIYEPFGVVEGLRANLWSLCDAHAQLLQWNEAAAACERLWNLRERLHSPREILAAVLLRAQVLLALGRFSEVERMLLEVEPIAQQASEDDRRFFLAARADWNWRSGRIPAARADAAQALAAWPVQKGDLDRARLMLLCQRAAFASGEGCPAQPSPETAEERIPLHLIAIGEQAARAGHDADAQSAFQLAVSRAESQGIPDEIAAAALAHGRWLLRRNRPEEARDVAGRVLPWAARDFDVALFQVQVFHALGQRQAWSNALAQARALAGERAIPAEMAKPPARLEVARN